MKKFLLAVSILLTSVLQLVAQSAPPSNLSGEELKAWLRTNWYDGKRQVLDYSTARGKMYNYVDNYNNKVTCVYSGYEVSKTYSETNTSTDAGVINCEHTVPQSWFDEAVRMRSDIHHLFPTVTQWNSDRGSDPFAEIPDNQTTKWMRGLNSQPNIPTSNIDEYSEDGPGKFEPREDHKGNLARSVFYFYTMHAGQNFDSGKNVISAVADINTLYQWHLKDPVDDRERERNRRVEVAQGNRNPFIDYPELVAKAWGFAPVNCSPATQLSSLTVSQKTTSSLTINWTNGSGDRRLIVVREGSAVNFMPTGTYAGVNADYSLATDQSNGQRIVYYNSGSSVTITGLKANTTYYVQAFESCASDKTYNTTSAPTITATTPDYACTGVPTAVTGLTSGTTTQNGSTLAWTNGSGDGRLVVIRKDEAPAFVPQTGTVYSGASANYATAATLADGSKLIYSGTNSEVAITGLQSGSLYFVKVFEICSNGDQYETAAAPTLAITTLATSNPPTGNGNVIAMQDFNGTANDGWVVTSGFSSSNINTGLPAGQRLRSGSSLQIAATTRDVIFSEVSVAGRQDIYLELYNSSVSGSDGNGFDAGDYFEVYVALNGTDFSANPDIRITGNSSTNQIRYSMSGTATITTVAGTPVEKVFTESLVNGKVLPDDQAPSKLQVSIPNGTTSVKVKLGIKTNASNEIWNVEDVALYAAASAPADCDNLALEGHAGEDKVIATGQSVMIGATAETGYTYSWSPAAGLSDATLAAPLATLTTPGTYVYTVTAAKDGCTSTDEVTVIVEAVTVPAPIVSDVTICSGESATLEVSNLDPKVIYYWYQSETTNSPWGRGATIVTGPLTATTSYYVEAVNFDGTASTRTKATVTVSGKAPEAATIAGKNVVCAGETVTYTATAQEGVTNYTWSVPEGWTIVAGANTAQLTVTSGNTAGNVTLKVANNCGESPAANLSVTIETVVTGNTVNGPQAVCVDQVTITGSVPTGGNGTYTYQWQTSTDGANFIPAAGVNNGQNYSSEALNVTTFIRRKVTSGSCGESISEAIRITVYAVPAAPIAKTVAICSGQTATLQVTDADPSYIYKWFADETGSNTLAVGLTYMISQLSETKSYYVEAVSPAGCAGPRTKVTVTVNAAPSKPTITQEANQLTASVAGSVYEWAKDGVTIAGATTQTITITEAGSYTVRVKNEAGCYSVMSDAVQATVQPTGIEDEIALGVIVAPNPAPGKFSISTEKPLQQAEIVITNLLGSVVYRATIPVLQDKLEIDLSKLPAGLYVVQLQAKQLKVVRKVLLTK
ncbi:endonuclease [Pontibacter sp. BT310]|uniref:Endonuclease n=1 Tax=Pontibacter populi TaxID=890055 RepID=A0ABS6X992_9BACT|nr:MULTISPECIES: endonuclease [Pontibacter]MBJ6117723.1 endonuclease [Pontibacter sp. BT310]MBR0570149.1 endonuclease [Microvirga sp. STS03]MBW3364575.1 endonuclease [Pontibacter populi]